MKHLLPALAVAAGLCGLAAPAAAVPTLTFAPSATQIAVGDSVTIDATLSGLGDEILSAYDLNFVYQPTILNWSIITVFNGVFGISLGANTNGLPNGNLGFDDSSLLDDAELAATQSDTLLLFRFILSGAADGSTTFTLGADPDFERNFVGLNFESLAVDVGSICIAVGTGSCDNDVPEPATGLLAGGALLAAGFARRQRKPAAKKT